MRTCQKCLGMMFRERAIDMVEGLVGYFFACVNCGKREEAEEGVQYLYKERPSRLLIADAEFRFRGNLGGLLEEKRETCVGMAPRSEYGEEATAFV